MRCTPIIAPILLIVGTFCLAGAAHAQSSPQEPVAVTPKVNLTLEQHHMIREIIKDTNPQPVAGSVKAEVGDKMPADIKAQQMPTLVAQRVPQIKTHEFFVADGQIFIVDPQDKEIEAVIKLSTD